MSYSYRQNLATISIFRYFAAMYGLLLKYVRMAPICHTDDICHYCDEIMGAIGSQITSLTIVYSTVYSDADQRKIKAPRHWPLCGYSPGTGEYPAQKVSNVENVPFDDVIMYRNENMLTITDPDDIHICCPHYWSVVRSIHRSWMISPQKRPTIGSFNIFVPDSLNKPLIEITLIWSRWPWEKPLSLTHVPNFVRVVRETSQPKNVLSIRSPDAYDSKPHSFMHASPKIS